MIDYKIRSITYSCNEETGECIAKCNGEEYRTQNFIEGFNYFWQLSGFLILQGIKNKLETQGFNRWTGEKES
jgi:hypothetical protein